MKIIKKGWRTKEIRNHGRIYYRYIIIVWMINHEACDIISSYTDFDKRGGKSDFIIFVTKVKAFNARNEINFGLK